MFNKTNTIMSLFDSASLVITPSGYKEGKLYSIKPTDGSGDLDVVRATSATRVNSDGLIEIPRTNLVTYSEQFDDASWTKTNASVIANSTTSPSGLIDAQTITEDNSYGEHKIDKLTSSVNGVHSIFVKSNGGQFIQIVGAIGSSWYQNFDIINGVVESGNAQSADIIDYGNGWYRIYAYNNSLTAKFQINIIPFGNSSRANNYTGNGTKSYYIWGAQLEQGVSATEYIPTTSVIRTKFAGIIQDGSSASNIPRLDYTNGSCPSILVEPQRTNVLLRSEEFDNAYWIKSGTTVTANQIVSPDGTQDSDLITSSSSAGYIYPSNTSVLSGAGGGSFSYSAYLKAGTASTVTFLISSNTGQSYRGDYNILLGTASTTSTNTTVSIINVGNGWYRCILNASSVVNRSYSELQIGRIANGLNFYIWGAQLEEGSYATSYVPTVASTVTRNADVISKTGISDLIGQTEGVAYVEVDWKGNNQESTFGVLHDGTVNNRMDFGYSATLNSFFFNIRTGGSSQGLMQYANPNIGKYKIAITYKNNDFALWINGVKEAVDISGSVPITTQYNVGNYIGGGREYSIINSKLYNTALTDLQLQQLTTI